jgi:hypothetical protein
VGSFGWRIIGDFIFHGSGYPQKFCHDPSTRDGKREVEAHGCVFCIGRIRLFIRELLAPAVY